MGLNNLHNTYAVRPARAASIDAFRPDIEGLRAIAVLAVFLYHFGVGLFAGGYVGVDVFFVVSGFVIAQSTAARQTGDLARDYLDFCERRIRRLLPALVPVLIVVYVVGFALFLDSGFEDLSQNLRSLGIAASNWSLLGQLGYFGAPAETNPLLHTWSLSVEAQYYLVAPLIAFAVSRKFGSGASAYASIALVSFLAATALVATGHQDNAFFNSLARFWEIALGAVVASSKRLQLRNPTQAAIGRTMGLLLIGAAVLTFSKGTPFPGPAALIPVAGTALVLAAIPAPRSLTNTLLSSPPLRYLGRLSYSLYLWHWPILVIALMFFPDRETSVIGCGMALSVFLAIGSYHVIERPFGSMKWTRRNIFMTAGLVSAALIFVGTVGVLLQGIPQRLPASATLALNGKKDIGGGEADCTRRNWMLLGAEKAEVPLQPCLLGVHAAAPSFVLMGDSHSSALIAAFDRRAREAGRAGLATGYASCAPIVTLRNKSTNHPRCEWVNEKMLKFIREHAEISTVVLAARWATYAAPGYYDEPEFSGEQSFRAGLEKTLAALSMEGREIWLLGQVPTHANLVPDALAVDAMLGRATASWATPAIDHHNATEFVTQTFRRLEERRLARFIDLSTPMCLQARCLVHLDGRPLYSDTNHLSNFGANYLAPLLDDVLLGDSSL